MRAQIVVDIDLDVIPEGFHSFEKTSFRFRNGHEKPVVRQIRETLDLVAVVVGDQHPVEGAHSDAGKNLQDVAGPKTDQRRARTLLDDVDVRGVLEQVEIVAQLPEFPGRRKIALMAPGRIEDGRFHHPNRRRPRGLRPQEDRNHEDKHKGEEGEFVKAALVSKLTDAIALGEAERLAKVVEGISELNPKSRDVLAGVRAEIEQLFGEYGEAEQKKRREVETGARAVLHQLRISGSAIGGVNPEVVPEWKNELDKIAQPYRERLDSMKARLAGFPA